MTTNYVYDEYVCNSVENVLKSLDTHGVAIIPSLLDEDEKENIRSGVWDFCEKLTSLWETPMDRNNPTTWKGFYNLQPLHGMLMQNYHVGQAQVSWDVRQNPKIIDIFSQIYQCSDLMVSMDGLSFSIPPENTNRGWQHKMRNSLFHTDQSYTRPDFDCIQSWVTANDVEDGDATLAFYRGSHKFHREFSEEFIDKCKEVKSKKDWFHHSEEQLEFYRKRGCIEQRIRCPSGSLVLWDSRTLHCGAGPLHGRANAKFRFVIYVCYLPKTKCSEKEMEKRKQAFMAMKTMSHNPSRASIFGDQPARTYGNERPIVAMIERPKLSDVGKKLLGFEYDTDIVE